MQRRMTGLLEIKKMGRLDNKIALITGATSGMGRESAFLFAEEGANVIIVGRNIEAGKRIERTILDKGGLAKFYPCDVSKEDNIIELKKTIFEKYGKLDILFNNAGIWVTEPLDNINEDILHKVFSTNFNSVLFMMKHFMGILKKSHGVILNNASMGGWENYTNGGKQYMYCSSKAAVIKITKLAAKDNAPDVRINCICPGLIVTEIFENRDFSRFDGKIPMQRMGDAIEVAKVARFLVSDDASYITGAAIPIDGGASLT